MEEISQDSKITEVQVRRLVLFPRIADWPGHSLGKAEKFFNFRMRNSTFGYRCTTAAPPNVQQLHHWIFALYHWLSKREDVPAKASSLKSSPLLDVKLLIFNYNYNWLPH